MAVDLFVIREARAEDVPDILECIKLLSVHVGAPTRFYGTHDSLKNALGFGINKDKRASALMGLENGHVVAVAVYCRHFNSWEPTPGILLDTLFVKEECRGKGYGRKMMAHLLAACKEDGGAYIEWTCHEQNKEAQKMYDAIKADKIDALRCYRLHPSKFTSSTGGGTDEEGRHTC